MQLNLTLAKIAQFCDGSLSSHSDPNQLIDSLTIDSREIDRNGIFVAIIGQSQDGHKFVESALQKGAVAAIVNKDFPHQLPNLIYVDDTTKALGMIAHNHRMQFEIPVVAITGSNGKTTVKEMLKSVCIESYGANAVLASTASLNNQWGVPLTLLQLTKEHEVAILEMGMNHPGELDYLSKLAQPTVAVVNNVMRAHYGFFNSLEEIAKAKFEIFNGLASDGVACINPNISYADLALDKIKQLPVKLYEYGVEGSNLYYVKDAQEKTIVTKSSEIHPKLRVLGEHNYDNALTVVALAKNIGCNKLQIEKGLYNFKGYTSRLEPKTAFNGAMIIDDSYNANPDSVKAAILAIDRLPKPHWLILGDLRELGEHSAQFHQEIGKFAKDNQIDVLITVGEDSRYATEHFDGVSVHFATNAEVVDYCLTLLPPNATLLIKGSKSMKLNEVVNRLV